MTKWKDITVRWMLDLLSVEVYLFPLCLIWTNVFPVNIWIPEGTNVANILIGITGVPADEWLGRCILTLTKGDVGCVSTEEVQKYQGRFLRRYSIASRAIFSFWKFCDLFRANIQYKTIISYWYLETLQWFWSRDRSSKGFWR